MRVFKDLGLVEKLGSGMSRILQSYDRDIFEIWDHFIKAIISFFLQANDENIAIGDNNGDISGDNQSDRNKVLLLLEKEPDITAKRMSEQTGLSTRKISRIIRELRESEVIIRMGSNGKGHWKINKSTY